MLQVFFGGQADGRHGHGTARANGMVRYWANNKGRRFFLSFFSFCELFFYCFCYLCFWNGMRMMLRMVDKN